MHKKVLIIGPDFYYFLNSISKAFRNLGWNAEVCVYDTPVHPYDLKNKVIYKLSSDKEGQLYKSRIRYKEYVEKKFFSFRPDLVFIVNGDNLLPDTVRLFSEKCATSLWLFDSIVRMPQCMDIAPVVNKVFCYEQDDIPLLKDKYGIDALFLPQAVDLDYYFPIPDQKKEYDIVFAGNIFNSDKRKAILNSVVRRYASSKIKIWGIYKPWYKGLWECLTRERRDVYMNCNTTYNELNRDYNSARLVLNIHHEQQRNGANPKVYEIAASGAYQICDANPYINTLFPNNSVGLYDNEAKLFELIDFALDNDMSSNARIARNIIAGNHTFVIRMNQMLNQL